MFKKLTIVLLVFALFVFCKNNDKTAELNLKQNQTITSVDSLLQFAENYVDQTVVTRGMVSHVCRISGKKLFIMGNNPDQMIKVTTGNNISQFDISLEGSKVLVKGKLFKLLLNMPAENQEHKHEKSDKGEVECATDQQALYSIECSYYKEL